MKILPMVMYRIHFQQQNYRYHNFIYVQNLRLEVTVPLHLYQLAIKQWGEIAKGNSNKAISTPVSLNALYCWVIGDCRNGESTSGSYHYIKSVTTTTITASLDSNHSKKFVILGK